MRILHLLNSLNINNYNCRTAIINQSSKSVDDFINYHFCPQFSRHWYAVWWMVYPAKLVWSCLQHLATHILNILSLNMSLMVGEVFISIFYTLLMQIILTMMDYTAIVELYITIQHLNWWAHRKVYFNLFIYSLSAMLLYSFIRFSSLSDYRLNYLNLIFILRFIRLRFALISRLSWFKRSPICRISQIFSM